VYCPQHLPNARKTAETWREYCRETGVGEIHLCAALTHGNEDYERYGFDSGVEFPPHNLKQENINPKLSFFRPFKGSAFQFASVAKSFLQRHYPGQRVFKTVFPSWDNTPRTAERAVLMLNGTPENYEYWLAETIDQHCHSTDSDTLVFINAWNEWAEGCHLEPDRRHGQGFLQATHNAISGKRQFIDFPHQEDVLLDQDESRRFWRDLAGVFSYHLWLHFGNLKLSINRRPLLRTILLPLVRLSRKLKQFFLK
jgi:lipopolysaccharide biosynthesis protein